MKLFQKIACLAAAAVLVSVTAVMPAAAVSITPYQGYTYDAFGENVDAPIGYAPDKTYFAEDMGMKNEFAEITDFYNYEDQYIYICDSHKDADDGVKDRIVVLDSNLQYVKEYTEFVGKDGKKYPIENPVGVFVSDDEIFVSCDILVASQTESGEDDSYYDGYCMAADYQGNFTRIFTNPVGKTPLVDDRNFRPYNVVEDNSGYIYIRARDVLDGMMVFDAEGNFIQYYGANEVVLNWVMIAEQMWKKIFSREAADALTKAVPTEMSSIFVDDEGFIYTATPTSTVAEDLRIRKLNASADNILLSDANAIADPMFGDRFNETHEQTVQSAFVDVYVDDDDVIAGLDQTYGRIFLYDQQSTLLTCFGYRDPSTVIRKGATILPVALVKLGERYLVLDNGQKAIVSYKPTDYISKLLIANSYYMKGWYVDGQPYWEEVLKYDANNTRAYAAIGKSLLEQEKYEEALDYLKLGEDRTSYSTAYAEYRREYIRANYWWLIPLIIAIIVGIVYLFKGIRRLLGFKDKKTRVKFN